MRRTPILGLALLLLAAATPSALGQGGGPVLYENGSPDMGSSYAGANARAEDAATAFQNPAGMTRLEGNQLLLGGFALVGELDFQVSPASVTVPPGSTNGGGNAVGFVPGIGAFGVFDVSDNLKLGFAVNALAAAGVDYNSQWVGRSFITQGELIIANIEPTIAYRVNDWLSIGAGLNIVYGSLDQEFKATTAATSPTIKIDNADDWAFAGTFGVLLEPRDGTRIGVTYRTEINLKLSGDLESPLPTTVNFDSDFGLPQGFNVGLYQDLTPTLALLLDGGWSNWGEFDRQPLTAGPITAAIPRDWDDTWRAGVGLQWRFSETWLLRTGFSYDSSPVDDNRRLPDIPVGDQYRFSIGVNHDFGQGKVFTLSYTFLYQPMDIDNVPLDPSGTVVLDGKYSPSYLSFLGANLSLSF